MGTAEFAVPTLRRLSQDGFSIASIITQPDRPSGRGQAIHFSPIKQTALELQLPVNQPATLKDEAARSFFRDLRVDCIVVVAYGKLLPSWLIEMPKFGIINLHGSLLPKYRGAAPIQWAMANGEAETGVCTMQIDQGLDTGPVYLCEKTAIDPEESVHELSARLADLGGDLVIRTLNGIVNGSLHPRPQDDAQSSIARILRKQDGYIGWDSPARTIHNHVRAFNPWPGAIAKFRGLDCRILKSRVVQIPGSDIPGTTSVTKGKIEVMCGDGTPLELLQVQLPGRKPVSGRDFANGLRVQSGEVFENGHE
jgi:methionyl-tRNA formyltransferase